MFLSRGKTQVVDRYVQHNVLNSKTPNFEIGTACFFLISDFTLLAFLASSGCGAVGIRDFSRGTRVVCPRYGKRLESNES